MSPERTCGSHGLVIDGFYAVHEESNDEGFPVVICQLLA